MSSPLMLTAAGYSTNRMGGCVIPGVEDDIWAGM